MTFEKMKLADAEYGYAVSELPLLGERRPIAASEGRGPAEAFVGESLEPRTIAEGPGGTMGFAAVPGNDAALFVITGLYPVFDGDGAGVHLFRAVNGFDEPWRGDRVVDLPFLHRIVSIQTGAGPYLIAATVCGGKEYRDDWSQPGAVYACRIPDGLEGEWRLQTILPRMHRNHGLALGTIDGVASLLVSGEEGLVALALPGTTDVAGETVPPWRPTWLLDHSVSEMALCDLDGDGEAELAVIEPFHGNRLAVYKQRDEWERIYDAELAYGHGLSAGIVAGEPVIVVGNRDGSTNLVCHRPVSHDPFRMEELVVDHEVSTTGTALVGTPHGEGILASNPAKKEYAFYRVRSEV